MCQHPKSRPHSAQRMGPNPESGPYHTSQQHARKAVVISRNLHQNQNGRTTTAHNPSSPTKLKGRRPVCTSPKSRSPPAKQCRRDVVNSNPVHYQRHTGSLFDEDDEHVGSTPSSRGHSPNNLFLQKSKKPVPPPLPQMSCSAMANQTVPLLAYAGAKFSEPPSPKVLPKPPVHWVCGEAGGPQNNCAEMTNVLKVMLKVHA